MDVHDISRELTDLYLGLSDLRRRVLHVNTKDQTNIELQNLIGRIEPIQEALNEISKKRDSRKA